MITNWLDKYIKLKLWCCIDQQNKAPGQVCSTNICVALNCTKLNCTELYCICISQLEIEWSGNIG